MYLCSNCVFRNQFTFLFYKLNCKPWVNVIFSLFFFFFFAPGASVTSLFQLHWSFDVYELNKIDKILVYSK